MASRRRREALIGCDQGGPLRQGQCQIEAIVDRSIKFKGNPLRSCRIVRVDKQLNRCCRYRCQGLDRPLARNLALPCLCPQHVRTLHNQEARRGKRLSQQELCGNLGIVFFENPLEGDAGIYDECHRWSRERSRRNSSTADRPPTRPMLRRTATNRRTAESRSRPTEFASARRACSSIEIPAAAARRRSASMTASSTLRIRSCPIPSI